MFTQIEAGLFIFHEATTREREKRATVIYVTFRRTDGKV